LSVRHPDLVRLIDDVSGARFELNDRGRIQTPDVLVGRVITIGDRSYSVGVGGLHSIDCNGTWCADDDHELIDMDVTSFYPAITLLAGWRPRHMTEAFNEIYQSLVDRRIEAKREGRSNEASSLKIVVNGTFGKTASQYSKLYDPGLMMRITLSGQMSLLMLIERLEVCDIRVISANTDGVTIRVPKDMVPVARRVWARWEQGTGFGLERTDYRLIAKRDVNSYIAITTDGKPKTKGVLGPHTDLAHNPAAVVVINAVIDYLKDGMPIERTITTCGDLRRFLFVRTVNGGATFESESLGRVVRWYYSTESSSAISYVNNGNKVPNSEASFPMVDLPEGTPGDIDYDRYVARAQSILDEIGSPCRVGMNTKAGKLRHAGVSPCPVDHTGSTTKAVGYDFSNADGFATQTGVKAGAIAIRGLDGLPQTMMNDGVHLYRYSGNLPRSYKRIETKHGVWVWYGSPLPLGELSDDEMTDLPRDVLTWIVDQLTPAQRAKVIDLDDERLRRGSKGGTTNLNIVDKQTA
jgi:hypothetical protein